MKTQWLFFDIGSTLIDETKAYEHRILDAIEGTDITFEQLNEKRKFFAKQNLRGDLEAIEYFGLKRTPWHSEDEYPYPDAEKVLAYLHAKGYKLGVIANQPTGTEDRLRSWDLLKYFSTVAASSELSISKPDKAIFLKALEMSNCTTENATMIGDRLDNDIYPAIELGMKTIWIKQGIAAYQQLDPTKAAPDQIINSLSELTTIL
ncbi:HAD family hydrolase [Ruminococcus albus]|uniref:Putative hydrolase of the HAD superfamily n=1 Tax=Ruminococcus albus TaxID=1264 RepID=A0A1I1MI02_RUMAL|nr:HAD family hydrolase [Ruminococcus albus]SFC82303.1 putative hydrolase of the HAD superfamily [Ruminococcus albus]